MRPSRGFPVRAPKLQHELQPASAALRRTRMPWPIRLDQVATNLHSLAQAHRTHRTS
jgi:hypothetical protein